MKNRWNFLTNHAHVLICIASGRGPTLRDMAEQVGITERATARIVAELVREGAVKRTRHGRRNHYEIQLDFPLRHSLEKHCSLGQLVHLVTGAHRSGAG